MYRKGKSTALSLAVAAALLLGTGAFAALQLPAPEAASLDENLSAQLSGVPGDQPILVFVHAGDIRSARGAAERTGFRLIESFDRVGVAAVVGPAGRVEELRSHRGVTYLEADAPVTLFMDTSHVATRGAEARTAFAGLQVPADGGSFPGKGQGAEKGKGPEKGKGKGPGGSTQPLGEVDGRGVSVAVIDGGIDGTHPMFMADGQSKVVRNMKLVCMNHLPGVVFGGPLEGLPPDTCPDEPNPFWLDLTNFGNDTDTPSLGGHGTHVAGTVAGYDVEADGVALHGAAPGAELVGLSIAYSLAIYGGASGMNWVLNNHQEPCPGCAPIRVINNSWGSTGSFNPNSVLSKLQDELVAEGVVVVWAAGNEGGDGSTTRLNPEAQSPTPGVLAVANYDDADTGTRNGGIASSSSKGQRGDVTTYPDISAPGTSITSACRPYLTICTEGGDYGTISGTSMAAPHIAGIVAQLLQADPGLSPGQVEGVLEETAYKFGFGEPYEPDDPARSDGLTSMDKGHGLVDATAALASVLGVTDPGAVVECGPGDPVIVDPEGDATWFGVPTPRPSEPTLDILAASVDSSDDTIQFTISVKDLQAEPPPGSTGIAFDWDFRRGAEAWRVRSINDALGEDHTLSAPRPDGTTASVVMTGSFDTEANTVTATVSRASVAAAGVTAIDDGQIFGGFSMIAWRVEGVLLLGVDLAGGACAHKVGEGTVVPPASFKDSEPPPPPSSGEERVVSQSYILGAEALIVECGGPESTTGSGIGGVCFVLAGDETSAALEIKDDTGLPVGAIFEFWDADDEFLGGDFFCGKIAPTPVPTGTTRVLVWLSGPAVGTLLCFPDVPGAATTGEVTATFGL